MTITFSERTECLLKEQVGEGGYADVDAAVEAAVQTVFGCHASAALESLLDAALDHTGRRVPLSEMRERKA